MCWLELNGSIASGKEEDAKKKKAGRQEHSSNNKSSTTSRYNKYFIPSCSKL
jgi:hypothetical protein